jgi:hypothetical protein
MSETSKFTGIIREFGEFELMDGTKVRGFVMQSSNPPPWAVEAMMDLSPVELSLAPTANPNQQET